MQRKLRVGVPAEWHRDRAAHELLLAPRLEPAAWSRHAFRTQYTRPCVAPPKETLWRDGWSRRWWHSRFSTALPALTQPAQLLSMVWRNSRERCNQLSPLRAFLIGVSVTPIPIVHHTGRDTTTGRTTTGRIRMNRRRRSCSGSISGLGGNEQPSPQPPGANPCASSTTPCAPAFRSFEISRYSGEFAHALNAVSPGNDISTTLSRSHVPSSTAGLSSADNNLPSNFLNTSKNCAW